MTIAWFDESTVAYNLFEISNGPLLRLYLFEDFIFYNEFFFRERKTCDNSLFDLLNTFLIFTILYPNCDFVELCFQVQNNASNHILWAQLLSDHCEQQIFPSLGCVLLLGFELEPGAVSKLRVLPHRLDSFFEEMKVGAIRHSCGSTQVLVHHPESLNL